MKIQELATHILLIRLLHDVYSWEDRVYADLTPTLEAERRSTQGKPSQSRLENEAMQVQELTDNN